MWGSEVYTYVRIRLSTDIFFVLSAQLNNTPTYIDPNSISVLLLDVCQFVELVTYIHFWKLISIFNMQIAINVINLS